MKNPNDRESKQGHGGGGMAARGVARPMAEAEADGSGGGHGHGEPYGEPRYEMLRSHHEHTLWVPWTILMLGVWTALAPVNFGYANESLWVNPSGGRGVWFSESTHTALRATLMIVNDTVCGLALIVLGWRALTPNRPVTRWLACGVGAWLSAAPLVFWAPTAAAYLNDTFVGLLVIALTILIPGMPNMILYMKMGPPVPPGWTYNPSSWAQRWIMIVTGFAGLLASRYLAMFQLGYVGDVWDPFFGESSRRVLNSKMSHSLPISDAGLGALAYTFEFLMGFMGSPTRWRTMPWMVTFFGILVIPLGLVHIFLVISQPVVVGYWCTFCLIAAAIMLPMIPLEVDEVVAMGQHLKQARRRGTKLWNAFWRGGPPEDDAHDEQDMPALVELPQRKGAVVAASVRGMSAPWTLVAATIIGVFAMAAPGIFGYAKPIASLFHLCGALVVVVSVVAMGEVVRAGRYLNVVIGLVMVAVPWLLSGAGIGAAILASAVGLTASALSIPRGIVKHRYGAWDRLVV